MEQQPQQMFGAQPQFVMMPVAQRNGLGVFAFFVALIGLFIPTGIVAMLGLVLGLAAIGRSPRGFATFAVILGLFGTIIWVALTVVMVVVGLVAAIVVGVVSVAGLMLTQPELVEMSTDMVNMTLAVEEYRMDHDELPSDPAVLGLGLATTMDPWGRAYVVWEDEESDLGYDLVSAGADGEFETSDDVRLSRMDREWEEALESFGERMEEFGERMERLDRHGCGTKWAVHCEGWGEDEWEDSYEARAIEDVIRRELGEDTTIVVEDGSAEVKIIRSGSRDD